MPDKFLPAEPGTPEYERRFDEVLATMDSDLSEEEALDAMEAYPDREVVKDVTDMFLSLLVPVDPATGRPIGEQP